MIGVRFFRPFAISYMTTRMVELDRHGSGRITAECRESQDIWDLKVFVFSMEIFDLTECYMIKNLAELDLIHELMRAKMTEIERIFESVEIAKKIEAEWRQLAFKIEKIDHR
jgi:hypothetical protein